MCVKSPWGRAVGGVGVGESGPLPILLTRVVGVGEVRATTYSLCLPLSEIIHNLKECP